MFPIGTRGSIADVELKSLSLAGVLILVLVRALRSVCRYRTHGLATQPPVFINRFMINLRMAGSAMSDYSLHISDQQQGQSTLEFRIPADRLGNIGETLQDGWNDEPCGEEDDAAETGEEGHL